MSEPGRHGAQGIQIADIALLGTTVAHAVSQLCARVCQDEAMALQLFDLLGPEASKALRERGQRRRFRRREVIFREGDIGDSVYFIERGHVIVKGDRTPAGSVTLAVLAPGDYFGDVAVLSTHRRRSAGIETLDECTTFAIDATTFLELRDRHPEIRRAMTESLARMCRRLVERLLDGRHVDAKGRLSRQLLHLDSIFEGAIPFSQEDLANYVGVTRVTVNQLLGPMVDAGVVAVRRGSVRVIDADGLRACRSA
jgi:CRP-like cAMP-binding protein